MSWKAWAAIVVVLLIAFLVFSYVTRQQWVRKDVERQMQIAKLQQEAEQHGADADAAARRVAAARKSADTSHAAMKAAEAELDALRRRVRNRPKAKDMQELQTQLDDADAFAFALEGSLAQANQTIDSLALALDEAGKQSTALEAQVAANEQAWQIERKRSDTWQQQTRRGRVKTALLAIGTTTAGGFAGYGIGRATQ